MPQGCAWMEGGTPPPPAFRADRLTSNHPLTNCNRQVLPPPPPTASSTTGNRFRNHFKPPPPFGLLPPEPQQWSNIAALPRPASSSLPKLSYSSSASPLVQLPRPL